MISVRLLPDSSQYPVVAAAAIVTALQTICSRNVDPIDSVVVTVARIQGGTAHNITAKDCEVLFEVRALPGVNADEIVARVRRYCETELAPPMRAISPNCGITIEEVVNSPGLDDTGSSSA